MLPVVSRCFPLLPSARLSVIRLSAAPVIPACLSISYSILAYRRFPELLSVFPLFPVGSRRFLSLPVASRGCPKRLPTNSLPPDPPPSYLSIDMLINSQRLEALPIIRRHPPRGDSDQLRPHSRHFHKLSTLRRASRHPPVNKSLVSVRRAQY